MLVEVGADDLQALLQFRTCLLFCLNPLHIPIQLLQQRRLVLNTLLLDNILHLLEHRVILLIQRVFVNHKVLVPEDQRFLFF